jgi:hypothetical protein
MYKRLHPPNYQNARFNIFAIMSGVPDKSFWRIFSFVSIHSDTVRRVLGGFSFFSYFFLYIANLLVGGKIWTARGKDDEDDAKFPVAETGTLVTFSVWCGGLAALLGIMMASASSTGRLPQPQRERFVKIVVYAIYSLRLINAIGWLCALSQIGHSRSHLLRSLAALVDVFWWTIPLSMQILQHGEEGLQTGTEDSKVQSRSQGCISNEKAIKILEARSRKFEPNLVSLRQAAEETHLRPQITLDNQADTVYAAQERGDPYEYLVNDVGGLNASLQSQTGDIGGFLRCGCCVDATVAPYSPPNKTDLEAAQGYPYEAEWTRRRVAFLKKPAIGTFLENSPGDEASFQPHRLCRICKRICGQILEHRRKQEQKSALSTLLYPKHQILSLGHHEDASALQNSAAQCHLCALIWGSLNNKQQRELVSDGIGPNGSSSSTSPTTRMIRSDPIRIVIIEDAFIPHFGGSMRPRRWECTARGDPNFATEVGSEFADPIYLITPIGSRELTFHKFMFSL